MAPAIAAAETEAETEETTAVVRHEALVTLPLEAVTRLDRMATASLLAAGLAHEIANPLFCLLVALEGLDARLDRLREADAAAGEDLDGLAAEVELAAVSGNEIFAQVRDFQQFLRPRELETAAPLDLKPAILRAVRMARARIGARSPVSVVLGDAPAVRIPGNRVTQMVLNLLLNAADAVGERPFTTNLIEVRLARVEHWAVIEVEDNGPGLDAATRARLFEPG